jgi:hypothetical protein
VGIERIATSYEMRAARVKYRKLPLTAESNWIVGRNPPI